MKRQPLTCGTCLVGQPCERSEVCENFVPRIVSLDPDHTMASWTLWWLQAACFFFETLCIWQMLALHTHKMFHFSQSELHGNFQKSMLPQNEKQKQQNMHHFQTHPQLPKFHVCISPCLQHIQAHHCTKSFLFFHSQISLSLSCVVITCCCSRMWSSEGVGGCGSTFISGACCSSLSV